MFRLRDVVTLAAGESIRMLSRGHVLRLAGSLAVCAALIILASILVFTLTSIGLAVTIVLCFGCLGCFWAFRLMVIWDGSVLIITDRRCVLALRRGFFHRQVLEFPLGSIQLVEAKPVGRLARLFGLQTLFITASGMHRMASFPPIADVRRALTLLSPGRAGS